MSDETPRSGLPLLAAAQAQKHVTHNDALLQLDALTCARILDRDLSAPPVSPDDGDTYLVKASGTGAWAGQDGNIAYALDGSWRFYPPYGGLIAYVVDEAVLIVFNGSAWVDLASILDLGNVALLGVNTTADATNKLAVKSSALLFDNIGNGVQAKLNKHASADTASLLYQTDYSGRAEFGLTGDDNFHCKVSPDGAAWTEAVVVDKTSGALTLAAGLKLPNGSAAVPSLSFNSNYGFFYDTANSGIGIGVAGSQTGFWNASGLNVGAGTALFQAAGLSISGTALPLALRRAVSSTSTASNFLFQTSAGTPSAPSAVPANQLVGRLSAQGYGATAFKTAANLDVFVIEPTPSDTAMGGQFRVSLSALGAASATEVARFETGTGLSMFGANPVVDQNRAIRLRATTIAGAVAPSVAGNLFYHSDAQGGAGEIAVDSGSAYRHAGQAALTKLTTDANATYTPRASGRIVRDSAALTADRKLTLATTNVSDGHKVDVSRRGSSGGHNRGVYQADGTTLIVNLTDNTSADFIYDATAALWFQK